jgi:aerobic-type carbon monoxide dehydrogenase small subunit (CoxS/CutS family)
MDATFSLTVNGEAKSVTTDPKRPLLDVLREEFKLTGAKYGCGEGLCGACSVLLDDKRVFSCMIPIAEADKRVVVTIEGLSSGRSLHPVQQAFLETDAFQCGYCTPGMVMAAVAFLKEKPKPTDSQILRGMDGNLCRCCGYPAIVKAVRRAAELGGK